jgi:hypothetical protein
MSRWPIIAAAGARVTPGAAASLLLWCRLRWHTWEWLMAKKTRKKSKPAKKTKTRAKKSVPKKKAAKRVTKRKAKRATKPQTIGDRLSNAYHTVVDTVKGTDQLRNKLEKPGTSEIE